MDNIEKEMLRLLDRALLKDVNSLPLYNKKDVKEYINYCIRNNRNWFMFIKENYPSQYLEAERLFNLINDNRL